MGGRCGVLVAVGSGLPYWSLSILVLRLGWVWFVFASCYGAYLGREPTALVARRLGRRSWAAQARISSWFLR